MAGHARYTALLDACVLYSIAMTDSLLSLATAGLFAAKWSAQIEEEWTAALEKERPDLKGRLELRRDCMRAAILDWEVPASSWQALSASIRLPDPDDAHVLAAAIAGHADCIVTTNIKDFPIEVLDCHGIQALHPDQFIVYQWDLDPLVAVAAFKRMRARRKKPEESPEGFAQAIERNGLAATAQLLRDAAELI